MTRIATLAIALLTALAFAGGWQVRHFSAQRESARHEAAHAQALADAIRNARVIEQQLSLALLEIGEQYEHAKQQAASVEADVIAALRAGHLQLRREWQRCETDRVSDIATTTAERDAIAADRDALAAAIVRTGRDADDHIAACQAVIRAYLAITPEATS